MANKDDASFLLFAPKRADGAADYSRLSPLEMQLCVAIGARVLAWARDNAERLRGTPLAAYVDGLVIAADIGTVHLIRPLDLRAMLESDDLNLISEYTIIAENLNRPLAGFPAFVKLRFAQSSVIH